MRRGFKEMAKRLAIDVRAELELDADAPLDPYALAALYGIPIFPLGELTRYGCSVRAVSHFSSTAEATFSAALIPVGSARVIIENEAHAATRRRASIAHELAHILLEHEFTETILTLDGCRSAPAETEAEADQLGGELLIPYESALRAALARWPDEHVARHYGVSRQYAAMRMNASGARKVAARQRRAYQRARSVRN